MLLKLTGSVCACPSAPRLDGIAVCLLDVEDAERLSRLERRNPGRWDDAAKAAFLRWARWHRAHAADPRARPEVITATGWEAMRWDRWLGWTRDDDRWKTTVITTGGRTVDDTVSAVQAWISAARTALSEETLSLARGWTDRD